MSARINQPINQVRLTNVAVVRFNTRGKRFEIACYRNKVLDYRAGLETDLSEVLQTDRIFTNVSKGEFAKSAELQKAFGTKNEEDIAKIILEKGNSLQVSDLERNQIFEQTQQKIAVWIAENCVHPETNRPYTVTQIKQALQDANFTVQPHKPIKKQYLDAVKYLKSSDKSHIKVERAMMELSLDYPIAENDQVQTTLEALKEEEDATRERVQIKRRTETSDRITLVVHVDPSVYRDLTQLAKDVSGRLEIMVHHVVAQVDSDGQPILGSKTIETSSSKPGVVPEEFNQELERDDNKDDSPSTNNTEEKKVEEKFDAVDARLAELNVSDDKDTSEDSEEEEVFQAKSKKNKKKARKAKNKQILQTLKHVEESDEHKPTIPKNNSSRVSAPVAKNIPEEKSKEKESTAPTEAAGQSCNTCGGSFATPALYRAHFRSDWHRYNQKLKLSGVPPVSEAEFLACDADSFFATDTT